MIGTTDVMFGLGLGYDDGVSPGVALNALGVVVEVHKAQTWDTLWCHVGQLTANTIRWGASAKYDDGITPRVSMNDAGAVVEVHETQGAGNALYCRTGSVNAANLSITWNPSARYDDGTKPSVALNNGGTVVEVHETNSPFSGALWCRVGTFDGNGIRWNGSREYDQGRTPCIALDDAGQVVEMHASPSSDRLWYRVGRVNGDTIDWSASHEFRRGAAPSLALAGAGLVIALHSDGGTVWSSVGSIQTGAIVWGLPSRFDDGAAPSVAASGYGGASGASGAWAVQVHTSELFSTLWYSSSRVTDRARWMSARYEQLRQKSLKGLVVAGSHDAGMYTGNPFGLTQSQSVLGQLTGGVRYFDLRPDRHMNIVHGIVTGPPVQSVLDDLRRFMQMDGHAHELVIVKFSHFDGFDDATYTRLTDGIRASLSPWLLPRTFAGRLADIPFESLTGGGSRVLVVCDGDYPRRRPVEGIYVYRDWDSSDPGAGDLTVYDCYSDTTSYETMRSDQLAKFGTFDGTCKNDRTVPCDLFLLSWTLTPVTDVADFSKPANRNLADALASVGTNGNGRIINVVYVDDYQESRAPDVAMTRTR